LGTDRSHRHRYDSDAEASLMEWSTLARGLGLFLVTAIAELLGCYLPLLWVTGRASAWLLVPAACSLVIFVWLLTLHPAASGRVYAAYGAVYIATAILWLWLVDGVTPGWRDYLGVALALSGAAVIASGTTAR
jgi:small multidrug resistance family-3 protein